jgi:hypothetical protein
VGQAISPGNSQEDFMTAPQIKNTAFSDSLSDSFNNSVGTALLLFGTTLSYLHIEAISRQIASALAEYGSEALGLIPAIGLAAAGVLQELTSNPASALSAVLQFLLSFWPVAIVFLGATLLRKTIFSIRTSALLAENTSDSMPQGVRE